MCTEKEEVKGQMTGPLGLDGSFHQDLGSVQSIFLEKIEQN